MTGFTQELLWQQLQKLLPDNTSHVIPSFCVAFSGGLDSSLLLHVLSQLHSTEKYQFSLKAIHINHQLQADSQNWADFCQDFCASRDISLQTIKVKIIDSKKLGTEAAARTARYNAFKQHLSPEDSLLTAHHLDDQIETVFLHLLRGTGVQGAAAINPCSKLGENYLLRPLLTFDRQQLVEYAQSQNLQWIDDPSNFQTHFNRNYLRHEVLPTIEKRWPAYRKTIQRFANNARSEASVLEEYIAIEFETCFNSVKHSLFIESLMQRNIEKRLMILRYWIKQQNFSMPGESVLLEIHAMLFADEDANPLVEWGDARLRRYRNELYLESRNKKIVEKREFFWDLNTPQIIEGMGELSSSRMLGQGIQVKYASAPIKVSFRQGGEKCQPVGREGTHSLKKLFQEYAIPPWQRDSIPLIYIDQQIAAVVGYFYCSPFAAEKNESGFVINLN